MKKHTIMCVKHELLAHCLTRGKIELALSVYSQKYCLLQSHNVETLLLKLCHFIPLKDLL